MRSATPSGQDYVDQSRNLPDNVATAGGSYRSRTTSPPEAAEAHRR